MSADRDRIVASPGERDTLRRLVDRLGAQHYLARATAIGGGALYPADLEAARAVAQRFGDPFGALYRLLGLGDWVTLGELGTARDVVLALDSTALLERRGELVRTNGWVLVPVLGRLHLTGVPSTFPAARAIGAPGYLGNDSLLLAAAIGSTTGLDVLDVGCGSGVQGLLATRAPASVVLCDPEPFGLRLASLNACLSGDAAAISIRRGELYDPVVGEAFDLIVTLPPYVPTLAATTASPAVAGGPDGLGVLRPLLEQAPAHLRPGGRLIALAQLLCRADGPVLAGGGAFAGLEVELSCFDWRPLQPYLVALSERLAGPMGDARVLLADYAAALRAKGVTGVCSAFIEATPSGVEEGSLALRGFAPLGRDAVFSRCAGASLVGEQRLVVDALDRGTLDGPSAALLRAVDGERSVAAVAAAAWGRRADAAEADLVDQAIARLSALAALGALRLEAAAP